MPKAEIIGLGRSGIAAARLLKKQGYTVTLSDRNHGENLQKSQLELTQEGISVKLGHSFTLDSTDLPDLIIISPGVPWDLPALIEAREKGIETIGEIELAWRSLSHIPWVGITGTNGKTTTTALIASIFQAAGLNAPPCGNIGYPACELALQDTQPDWIIAELSSYQIEASSTLAPKIGIWTTFTPDHLARHKTLDNYYQIKASLLRRCEAQIFNGDDPYLRKLGPSVWEDAHWTSIGGKETLLGDIKKGAYLEDSWITVFGELIMPSSLFKMVGAHNQQNLLMASAAARLANIEKKYITQAMTSFSGVSHRLELICNIDGIEFINDSKATNYDAAQVGLASVKSPVILIAGGEVKEGDDSQWLKEIQTKAVMVLLIGDAATIFAKRLQEINYPHYEIVETMENAVNKSLAMAKKYQAKVVLLSPACASFDQYQSFEHRGDHFRQLCQSI
jgi:UDP-N-acetylmuramoylalanine--D-glutamate ligase